MSALSSPATIFLLHIENEFDNLEKFTDGVDFDKYTSNTLLQYGVHKSLENIGEACRHICKNDENAKEKFPNFDFRGWIGFKNKINHDYFAIDYTEVWGTLKNDIPLLREEFYKSFKGDLEYLSATGKRSRVGVEVNSLEMLTSPGVGTGSSSSIDDVLTVAQKNMGCDDPEPT